MYESHIMLIMDWDFHFFAEIYLIKSTMIIGHVLFLIMPNANHSLILPVIRPDHAEPSFFWSPVTGA